MSQRDRVRALAETNADDLLRYFLRRVDSKEDAADLLGETMLVVWRRAADLPSADENARMWMFGIARRVLLAHQRGARRQLDLVDVLKESLTQHDPFEERVEMRLAAEESMKRLSQDQREIVLLVLGEGFSLIQTAKIMRVSPSTTRSRYAKALSVLRAHSGAELERT